MLIKKAPHLNTFIASDGCILAEVIHPNKDATHPGLSLARASLGPGESTKPHSLGFVEIYYFLSGQGVMHLDDETQKVGSEDCVYAPANSVQWVENQDPQDDLVFLCVCHPAYDPTLDRPAGLA